MAAGYPSSNHRPLSSHTPEQLRARAIEYREMAESATSAETAAGLLRLAAQFEEMALTRDRDKGAAAG